LVPAELDQRALAVHRHDRLETIQRPFDLLLQREVVFDDQQRRQGTGTHLANVI